MAMNPRGRQFLQQTMNIARVGLTIILPLLLVFVLIGLIFIWIALQLPILAAGAAILLFIVLAVLAFLSFIPRTASQFAWTGIAAYQRPNGSQRRARTLWDWLGLLIIPLVLAAGAVGFSALQNQANLLYDMRQAQIAHNQEQQNIIQTYLDRMTDLILNPNIRLKQGQQGVDLRILARARTLTVLLSLDPDKKALVVQFLYYGELIGQYNPNPKYPYYDPVVDLTAADLSGVNLSNTYLGGANFQVADLSGVTLIGTNLSGAYLAQVNLSNAHLGHAYFCYANLSGGSNLSYADLSNAHLSGANLAGATMIKASLKGANLSAIDADPKCPSGNPPTAAVLSGANLSGANLSDANLKGANLSKANLAGVVWRNSICPDGTKSDHHGNTCIGHLKI